MDISSPPTMMAKVWPSAASSSGAIWMRMLTALELVAKRSFAMPKKNQSTPMMSSRLYLLTTCRVFSCQLRALRALLGVSARLLSAPPVATVVGSGILASSLRGRGGGGPDLGGAPVLRLPVSQQQGQDGDGARDHLLHVGGE